MGVAGALDGPELLAAVRERIEADPCWVLVLDSADDLGLFGVQRKVADCFGGRGARNLYDFVPHSPAGTVLWTSRDKRIGGSIVGATRAINVPCMTTDEAWKLLATAGGKKISKNESQAAAIVLAWLDRLPLAISQAAAHMWRSSSPTPIKDYLSKLKEGRKKRWELMRENGFNRHRRPQRTESVLETWDPLIERIRQEDVVAYDILRALAFVYGQYIPLDLIVQLAAAIKGRQAQDSKATLAVPSVARERSDNDHDNVTKAIDLLHEFSFLNPVVSRDGRPAYGIPVLVQHVMQYSLSIENRREDEVFFSRAAFRVVAGLFPEARREQWAECEKYEPHARTAASIAGLCGCEPEATELLTKVSIYLSGREKWRDLEDVAETLYHLQTNRFGKGHPDALRAMSLLATAYHCQGRHDESEKIRAEALALQQDVLGDRHPDTLQSMALLAKTYQSLGRLDESEKVATRALDLHRSALGEKHAKTIQTMLFLTVLYRKQEKLDEAEKMAVEVLELQRSNPRNDKVQTSTAMYNLALVRHRQKPSRAEAEDMLKDCARMQLSVLGPRNLSTRKTLGVLRAWKVDTSDLN